MTLRFVVRSFNFKRKPTTNRDTFRASIDVAVSFSISFSLSVCRCCFLHLPLARSFCQLIHSAALHSCMALGWPFCEDFLNYVFDKLYIYITSSFVKLTVCFEIECVCHLTNVVVAHTHTHTRAEHRNVSILSWECKNNTLPLLLRPLWVARVDWRQQRRQFMRRGLSSTLSTPSAANSFRYFEFWVTFGRSERASKRASDKANELRSLGECANGANGATRSSLSSLTRSNGALPWLRPVCAHRQGGLPNKNAALPLFFCFCFCVFFRACGRAFRPKHQGKCQSNTALK